MLNKAGIDVDMVVLSTRSHGFIRKEYPMERQLNYSICSVKIGNKNLLMDATEKYLAWGCSSESMLERTGPSDFQKPFWMD